MMQNDVKQQVINLAERIVQHPELLNNVILLQNQVRELYEKLVILRHWEQNPNTPPLSPTQVVIPQEKTPITERKIDFFQKPAEPKPLPTTPPNPSLEQVLSQVPPQPVFEPKTPTKEPQTLNDVVAKQNIQIGLNDKIAFISHLFGGSEADYNQAVAALSQLNSAAQVQQFIQQRIKPVFNNWEGKEPYEERFFNLFTRKFN